MSLTDRMRDSLIQLRTDMVFENSTEAYDLVKNMFADGRVGYNNMSDEEISVEYDDWFWDRKDPYHPELKEENDVSV